MEHKNGAFVISLDFELHWGIFDVKSINEYKENLDHTRQAIHMILQLSEKYNIRLTFSTVGILFAKDKDELNLFLPEKQPTYTQKKMNPYLLVKHIGDNEVEDPYHYAQDIIKKIAANTQHEIGTHTFGHYYCCEAGQTKEQFHADLKSANKIATYLNIPIKSIVFPRNQVNEQYLEICSENGITSYRGTEKAFVYNPNSSNQKVRMPEIFKKGLRLLDSYINIFGFCTYPLYTLKTEKNKCINLPSSQFLRPFNKKLYFFESLKIRRIKKGMSYAAKKNHLYHLWWHPHNFGANLKQNITNLETIFKHYQKLNTNYGFESNTMTSLTKKI